MRLTAIFPAAFAFVVVLVFGSPAHAVTISAVGSSVVANGGQPPLLEPHGSPLEDSDFFFQIPDLRLFSVTLGTPVNTGGGFFGTGNPANYTQLTAPYSFTTFYTGILYDPTINATDYLLATFQATARPAFQGDFYVRILDGNSDGNVLGNSSVAIGVNGGTSVEIASLYTSGHNEFSEFLITGASPTDTFQVYATAAPGDRASIGGLVFDVVPSPVPEPSSLALVLTGIGSTFAAIRRRRA